MNATSLSKRVVVGYTVGAFLLALAIPLYMTSPFSWDGPVLGCIALGFIYRTAQIGTRLVERLVVAGFISVVSAAWLFIIVSAEIGGGRGQYQSIIPFLIGFIVAIPVSIWPVRRFAAGCTKRCIHTVLGAGTLWTRGHFTASDCAAHLPASCSSNPLSKLHLALISLVSGVLFSCGGDTGTAIPVARRRREDYDMTRSINRQAV
jgi:hypothetical protein